MIKKKYILMASKDEAEYGYGGWTGRVDTHEERIATFDHEKDAKKYIKESMLKTPDRRGRRIFKRVSLLSYYDSAWVEEYISDSPLPHNPK